MQQSPEQNPLPFPISLTPGQFQAVRDMLAHYSGIYLDKTSQRSLSIALAQRLNATGLSFEAYLTRLKGPVGQAEMQALSELIANHETIFFRNMLHMRALRDHILPELHRKKGPYTTLRIWSAGCSTGEEAYSLAILALESLGNPPPRPVEIWATDLSEAALTKARHGIYRGRTFTNMDPNLHRRYFERKHNGWSIREPVRNLVHFERLNLLEPFPAQAQGVDIIFCQNVTIYFQLETFRNLIARFYDVLPEGGILFLGFSETLWNVFDKFRLREILGAFAYVKEPATSKPAATPATQRLTDTPPAAYPDTRLPSRPPKPASHTAQQRKSLSLHTPHADHSTTLPIRSKNLAVPDHSGTIHTIDAASNEAIEKGQTLLNEGRADEALAMLYQLPMNGAHAPRVLVLIARAHANRNDFDLAVAEARRALELNSLTVEAYVLLGMIYAQQRQLQEATQQFERARYLDPDSALISYHLAESYRQTERRDLALREYRNALRKLSGYTPEIVLDGVAAGWIRDTCERYITLLEGESR